jgi:hypothetical protein
MFKNALLIIVSLFMSLLSKIRVYNLRNPKTLLSIVLQLSLLLLAFYPFLYPKTADATLNTFYVRFDRQSATAALSGTVCMQSSQTAPGVAKVIVQFPSTFTGFAGGDTSFTDDTTVGNLPSGATAWPVTGTSLKVSSATTSAVFLVGDLASSANTYCFHFVGGASTVGTAGINEIGQVVAYAKDNGGTAIIESGQYATAITTGVNSEQIGITASISASFSFALSGGDASHNLPLGVLNNAATVTSPYQVTATISTNAHNGFLAWLKGTQTNGQLHSTTANASITSTINTYPTLTDLASNTGYGVFAYPVSGSPSIASGYATGPTGTSVGDVDETKFNQLASKTGYQSGTTFNIGVRAKPATTDPAATDYADTITIVASGSF